MLLSTIQIRTFSLNLLVLFVLSFCCKSLLLTSSTSIPSASLTVILFAVGGLTVGKKALILEVNQSLKSLTINCL